MRIFFYFISVFVSAIQPCFAQGDSVNIYLKNRASGYYTNLDSAFKNVERVYYLDINEIALRQISEDFIKFKNLEILQVFGCQVESITDKLGELKNLKKIDVSFNLLKTIPPSIINLQKLKILDISHNQIKTIPKEVYELKALETLILSENPINIFERRRIVRALKGKNVSIVFKVQKRSRRELRGKKRKD